jgi:hypothetical protein
VKLEELGGLSKFQALVGKAIEITRPDDVAMISSRGKVIEVDNGR